MQALNAIDMYVLCSYGITYITSCHRTILFANHSMFVLDDDQIRHLAKTEGLAIKQLLKFVQTNLKIQVYVLITQLLYFVL